MTTNVHQFPTCRNDVWRKTTIIPDPASVVALRRIAARYRLDSEDIAELGGVDVRTAQRWLSHEHQSTPVKLIDSGTWLARELLSETLRVHDEREAASEREAA